MCWGALWGPGALSGRPLSRTSFCRFVGDLLCAYLEESRALQLNIFRLALLAEGIVKLRTHPHQSLVEPCCAGLTAQLTCAWPLRSTKLLECHQSASWSPCPRQLTKREICIG